MAIRILSSEMIPNRHIGQHITALVPLKPTSGKSARSLSLDTKFNQVEFDLIRIPQLTALVQQRASPLARLVSGERGNVMDVKIIVSTGSDISKIEREFTDIYRDDTDCDGDDIYFVGKSSDEEGNERDSKDEWYTYEEAIDCCGFVEGIMPEAETLIEGSGGWAMANARETDIYCEAFKRGEASR